MSRKRVAVESGLLNKGFRRREGDHHYYIYHTLKGKKTAVFTKTSHSHTDISTDLMSKMSKQCKLIKKDFESLVDCPLSQIDYEQKLLAGQHIAP